MKTIELNDNYDIFVLNGDLAVQRDDLSVIRQNILNKLSLVQGEDINNLQNGLNLAIIFGDNISFANKQKEIERVIYNCANVVSVDRIDMTADPNLRVGYFKCYITVSTDGEEVQTSINFGA